MEKWPDRHRRGFCLKVVGYVRVLDLGVTCAFNLDPSKEGNAGSEEVS